MASFRIVDIARRIVDFVDTRVLRQTEVQHTAVNRARVRHLELIFSRDFDVIAFQAELVRHRIRCPICRIRTGVVRPRCINLKITTQVSRMTATEVCCRRGDIVLYIRLSARTVVLHRPSAVIDLMCARGSKGDIRRIDVRLVDGSLGVGSLIKLVVRRDRTQCIVHRCPHVVKPDELVLARIRIFRHSVILDVLTANPRKVLHVRTAYERLLVFAQNCRIGRRNKRVDRSILRRPVVCPCRWVLKLHIHFALCDRIVIG